MKSVKIHKRKLMILHFIAIFLFFFIIYFYFFDSQDPVWIKGKLDYLSVNLEGNISFSAHRMDFYGSNGVYLKKLSGDVVLDSFKGKLEIINDSFFVKGVANSVHIDDGIINTTSFKIVIDEGTIPISLEKLYFRVDKGKFRFGDISGSFDVATFLLCNFTGVISFGDRFLVEGDSAKAFMNTSKIYTVYYG